MIYLHPEHIKQGKIYQSGNSRLASLPGLYNSRLQHILIQQRIVRYYLNAGGADNFLSFIKNELFPIVNKNYRTIQDSNAIMGLSFGGLLSSYILFKQPDMFKSYIIISPSLFWNGNSILKTEADYYRNHKELNKMVYVAYGSQDDNDWVINPTNEFIQIIQTRKYESLKFIPQIFKGETHISVFPIALTHGLKAIFKR